MDALDFLNAKRNPSVQPLYVLHGEEDFLRLQARSKLEKLLLDDADPAFALASYPGEDAQWSVIRNELDTRPFLAPRRVVVIEQADPFVSEYRSQLEKLVDSPSASTLILEVKSWPKNTKLAKKVPDEAVIVCNPPAPASVPGWCMQRAESEYQKKLSRAAAGLLVELAGTSLGLLDQELAKLAAFAGTAATIAEQDVEQVTGRSSAAETFKIFDAIGQGQPAAALAILHGLFEQGEEPLRILGAFSWQLRRLAQAGRLAKQGMNITQALDSLNVPPFARRGVEQQLKHLGRRRLDRLYDWLLETDLGLKGGNPLPERTQLERLVVRLARPR
ncbi:MAG TPA: DNA polymerase III subunit delta [Gemmataceae bacterium]|nr:DNA polymerase III subunit delta [Gemmataceae bacterium]